jgi:hypothetical protein
MAWIDHEVPSSTVREKGDDGKPAVPTLATFLALIAPDVPPVLVPRQTLDGIIQAASRLFPVTGTGFECRLNGDSDEVDLGIRIAVQDGSAALLAGTNPDFALGGAIAADPLWQRVSRICRIWGDARLFLYPCADRICLEIDRAETREGLPRPSLMFFDLVAAARRDTPRTFAALCDIFLPLAQDNALAPAQIARLRHVCATGSAFGSLCHAGTALARPGGDVRLVFQIPRAGVSAYLSTLGFGSRAREIGAVVDLVAGALESVMVQVDVSTALGPRIGIDLMGHPVTAMKDILKGLLRTGLCATDKAVALAGWPYYPAGRDIAVTRFGGSHEGLSVMRHINHVKLAFSPDAPVTAKAYLYAACLAA